MIVAAINRARAIPRNIALLKVITNKSTVYFKEMSTQNVKQS